MTIGLDKNLEQCVIEREYHYNLFYTQLLSDRTAHKELNKVEIYKVINNTLEEFRKLYSK